MMAEFLNYIEECLIKCILFVIDGIHNFYMVASPVC